MVDSAKGRILRIRCDEKNFKRFKRFAADFNNYEKALVALLEMSEIYPELIIKIREGGLGKY